MNLGDALDEQDQRRENLAVYTAEYTVESQGHKIDTPVVHLICRDEHRRRRIIKVEGFRPYFHVPLDELRQNVHRLLDERRILAIEIPEPEPDDLLAEVIEDPNHVYTVHPDDATTDLYGNDTAKIYTKVPEDVGDLRDFFDKTFEADIPFARRFLMSSEIYTGCSIPRGEATVRYENWSGHSTTEDPIQEIRPADPPEPVDDPDIGIPETTGDDTVRPRMLTCDIEVATEGDGFPDATRAKKPVTAITAHDSYSDTYGGWILRSEQWDFEEDDVSLGDRFEDEVEERIGRDMQVEVFSDEKKLLAAFNRWVVAHNFDLVTGWNCIPEDEPVRLADGRERPISEIDVGDDIVGVEDDETSIGTVTNKWETGEKEVLSLTTARGRELRCTEDHRVLVGNESDVDWKRAGDIEAGEYLLTPKSLPHPGDSNQMYDASQMHRIGLIASDGSFSDGEGVRFYNTDLDLHQCFESDNDVSSMEDGSHSQRVDLGCETRSDAVELLESFGIPSGEKMYEEWDLSPILSLTDEEIAAFLAGVMDGDGYVTETIQIGTENESVKTWIRTLFLRLGIWATPNSGGVGIGMGSVGKFKDMILPHMESQHKIEGIMDLKSSTSADENTVPPYLATEGADTAGKRGFRTINDKIKRGINIKRYEAHDVDSQYADEWTDFVFCKIDSIERDGVEKCYDIETTVSSFTASDIVVHNCNDFDYPYLIQRSQNLGCYKIYDWSPFEEMGTWKQGNDNIALKTKGVIAFDMMEGFKKTLWQKRKSNTLDAVSRDVLGQEEAKLEVDDYDDEWHDHPFAFMAYNVRDTEAVIGIEQARGIIDLFDNIRRVTGATYPECENNGVLLDVLFCRKAYEEGMVLPTNTMPEEGNFHGAFVYDTVPGKHQNVVYPDLASLYPYIIWTLNISPETLFTTREAHREAGYTDGEVFTAYIDKRDFKVVPKGEEVGTLDTEKYKGAVDQHDSLRKPPGMLDPRYDEIYFVKPQHKEGFIRKVVDDLVDMKYEYKGTDMYDAVKRVTNSIYGVLGDSNSMGGKGFRLFDWRLGEATTLTGQKVIRFTGNKYVDLINDYYEGANASLVGGDTDSVVSAIPGVDQPQTALRLAQRASEEFLGTPDDPGLYDEFMEEEFDVMIGSDEHKMEVEIESLASACFFVQDFDADEEVGVKKRYAQDIIWDDSPGPDDCRAHTDGHGSAEGTWYVTEDEKEAYEINLDADCWDPTDPHDRIDIVGFEYVRSDSADITAEMQYEVLTTLLTEDDPEDEIADYVDEQATQALDGDIPVEKIARPKGISNPLEEYGRDNDTGEVKSRAGPTYRGAKYSNAHFDWERITPGGNNPLRIYIDRVRADDYPEVYTYDGEYPDDAIEIDEPVDAVTVNEPDRLPDGFEPDYEKMVEKEMEDKVGPIIRTTGMRWDHVVGDGRQTGLADF